VLGIGTVHAIPSWLTFDELIWLCTLRVLPMSAFGIVQPVAVGPLAAAVLVVSGVVAAGVDAVVAGVLADVVALSELLLPPPHPATTSATRSAPGASTRTPRARVVRTTHLEPIKRPLSSVSNRGAARLTWRETHRTCRHDSISESGTP